MKTTLVGVLAAIGLTISACGEIQDQSNVKTASTSDNGQYIAGIGDAILTIENSESLPNAVGGAESVQ